MFVLILPSFVRYQGLKRRKKKCPDYTAQRRLSSQCKQISCVFGLKSRHFHERISIFFFFIFLNTVEIVYNDIGYNDEPDITTE